MLGANWIDGSWCEAAAGDAFEAGLRAAGSAESVRWPRSSQRDLARAIEALERGARGWRALEAGQRRERLLRRLDRWQREAPGVDELCALLGLREGDLDADLEAALDEGDRALEEEHESASGPSTEERGLHLLRADGAELWRGLVRELFPALAAGRGALLLSDPSLPWVARELVRVLAEDELLGGAVALLHDDRATCWSAGLACDAFERAYLPGVEPRADEGRAPVVAARPRPFGAGVLSEEDEEAAGIAAGPTQVELTPARCSTFGVREDDAARAAAREVVERAFGPVRALSGQRAGQVGRVVCHQRRFSEFTHALLERLDAGFDQEPCRPFGPGLARRVEDLCRLGLDEGATLLRGGPTEGAGFRGGRRKGILTPSVFTNAEPNMGLVLPRRPAPVLALLRAESDAEVRTRIGEFEGDAPERRAASPPE